MRDPRRYLLRAHRTFESKLRRAVLTALGLAVVAALCASYAGQKIASRHGLDDFWSPGLGIVAIASLEVFGSLFLALAVLFAWRRRLGLRIFLFMLLIALSYAGLRAGLREHTRYIGENLLTRRPDLVAAFEEKFRTKVFLVAPTDPYPVQVPENDRTNPLVIRFAPLRTRNFLPNREVDLVLTDTDGREVAGKRLSPQSPDASQLVSLWRVIPGRREVFLSVQRRGWLNRALGGYLTFVAVAAPVPASPGPNFVLISYDALRADHLRCYGYQKDTSSSIDAMAAQSALFSNASSQASSTLPSHVSILTSLYPINHAMVSRRFELPGIKLRGEINTLAEYLRDGGYECAAFTEGGFLSSIYGFDRGFDVYDNGDGESAYPADGLIDKTFDKASKWVRDHRDSKFFVFIHSYQTHYPYSPPKPFDTMFDPKYAGKLGNALTCDQISDIRQGKLTLTDADISHIVALYDGEIRYADGFIGSLRTLLDEIGIGKNTVVILTSDHGVELNDHGIVPQHGETIYEDQTHVPLIFYCPAQFAPTRSEVPVELNDIMPTILDLAGIEPPAYLEGRSLVPILNGKGVPVSDQRPVIAEAEAARVIRSLRKGALKYIRNFDGSPEEFFDLSTDRSERNNLVRRFPDKVRQMRGEMDVWLERQRWLGAERKTDQQVAPLPQEVRDRLKALGYL